MDEDGLSQADSTGEPRVRMRWRDVRAARFSRREVRLIRFAYFDLYSREGERLRLTCQTPVTSWDREPASQAFCDRVAAVIERLAEVRPDTPVVLGDSAIWRWVWFMMGVAMTAFGAGLPVLAYLDNVSTDRLFSVAPVMAVMALAGLVIAWANRPWRRPASLTPAVILTNLNQLLARAA
jgi:hypothetical protein